MEKGVAIKSILKAKWRPPSGDALSMKPSLSTPIIKTGTAAKKTVQMSGGQNVLPTIKSQDEGFHKFFRETPLPRVAFLARQPAPPHSSKSKSKPKKKTKSNQKKSSSKRNESNATSSSKGPKGKTVSEFHKATTNVKSSKRLKKKNKSKNFELPYLDQPPPSATAGKQYVKELGTINDILRSVTDRTTHSGHESELIEGFIRPFSAHELDQLIQSIGNVASIHNHIPRATGTAGLSEDSRANAMKINKAKYQNSLPSIQNNQMWNQSSVGASTSKSRTKRKKSRRNTKAAAAKILHSSGTRQSAKSHQQKSTRHPPLRKSKSSASKGGNRGGGGATEAGGGGANKNVTKFVKPSIKSLFRKTQKSRSKSKKKSDTKNNASESALSDLSELDLVKSALLNKRFYDESMALERMHSPDTYNDQKIFSKKRRSKELKAAALYSSNISSTDDVTRNSGVSPREGAARGGGRRSEGSSRSSSKSSESAATASGGGGGYKEERTLQGLQSIKNVLEEVRKQAAYENYNNKSSMNDVLINYSHVIRDPEDKGINYYRSPPVVAPATHKNRGFANPRTFPYKLDNKVNLDEVSGFDKHLEKLKYTGPQPESQGILDIISLPKRISSQSSQVTGKYLRHEQILEETRSKAATGSSIKKEIVKVVEEKTSVTDIPSSPQQTINTHHHQQKLNKSRSKRKSLKSSQPKNDSHIEGLFSNIHKQSIPVKNEIRGVAREPVIESLTKAPVEWTESSLNPSTDHDVGQMGSSRWSVLNERTVQKSREMKAISLGRRREVPKDDLDDIRRKLDSSDERKLYLEKINAARNAFDTYNTFNQLKENSENSESSGSELYNKQEQRHPKNPYDGFESYSFDPLSKIRAPPPRTTIIRGKKTFQPN